ncbi:MAG: hypothetical protein QME14_04085 [Methanobacteriaceae archaeon]|nr:hypothetical protein [Methanobacteriaceae archaeon]
MDYSDKSREELLDILNTRDKEIELLKKSQEKLIQVEENLRKSLESSYQHQREFNELLSGSKAVPNIETLKRQHFLYLILVKI